MIDSTLVCSSEVHVAGRTLARKVLEELAAGSAPIHEARALAELQRSSEAKEHALEVLAGGPQMWRHASELCRHVLLYDASTLAAHG